jgi:hypothetical protein
MRFNKLGEFAVFLIALGFTLALATLTVAAGCAIFLVGTVINPFFIIPVLVGTGGTILLGQITVNQWWEFRNA